MNRSVAALPIPETGADFAIRTIDPCLLLAKPALVIVMVIHENRCKAVTLDHTIEFLFTFYAFDPPSAYCLVTETTRLTAAGQPAVSCENIPGRPLGIFTSVHDDFETPGNLQVGIDISVPRGRENPDYRDPVAIARLVDLADAVIQRYVR